MLFNVYHVVNLHKYTIATLEQYVYLADAFRQLRKSVCVFLRVFLVKRKRYNAEHASCYCFICSFPLNISIIRLKCNFMLVCVNLKMLGFLQKF